MTQDLITTLEDSILQIRFNRPQKKNALTLAMYAEMTRTIEAAESDSRVRVIVFTGSGGNYCAGNDLNDFPKGTLPSGELTPPLAFIASLVKSTVPLVAGVEGVAVGVGATMLLHMDCVVCDPGAKLIYPFVNLALVPEAGSSLLLPQRLGYTGAADLLLRGDPIGAQRAYDLGLVSELTAAGETGSRTQILARQIASKPPQSVRRTKKLLKGDTAELLDRIRHEEAVLLESRGTEEAAEAMAALREKRPPNH